MQIFTKARLIFMSLTVFFNCLAAPSLRLDPTVALVKEIIEKEDLVPDVKCVDYILMKNAEDGVDAVAVLEKHDNICGGEPKSQHRIFTVYIDQKTHEMASDKDDLTGDGILMPLPSPSQKNKV